MAGTGDYLTEVTVSLEQFYITTWCVMEQYIITVSNNQSNNNSSLLIPLGSNGVKNMWDCNLSLTGEYKWYKQWWEVEQSRREGSKGTLTSLQGVVRKLPKDFPNANLKP